LPTDDYNTMASSVFVVGDNSTSSVIYKYRLQDLALIAVSPGMWDLTAIHIDEAFDTSETYGGVFLASNNNNSPYALAKQNFSYTSLGVVLYSQSGYCICGNTNYFYVGETSSGRIFGDLKQYPYYDPGYLFWDNDSLYGGAIYGIAADDTYVYAGGATTNRIRRYNASDVSYDSQGNDYGGAIYSVVRDGTDLYYGGATTETVKKANTTDLAVTATSADFNSTIYCICCDTTYLYVGCADGKVYKLLKTDLSTVTSASAYSGNIRAICEEGSYVYIGGATTRKVYKLLKSDLSLIAMSAEYPVTILGMAIGDTVTVPA
jgi:hypothetical protein